MRSRFLVGETVEVGLRVRRPGSQAAVDPDVVRVSTLVHEGEPVELSPVDFTRLGAGDYQLDIDTSDLEVGVYTGLVTVSSAPAKVTYQQFQFVLEAP